jgi:hypothetical protein
MPKKARSKAPKKVGTASITVEVGQEKPPTIADVEQAIKNALASQPTDLFSSRKKVTIVCEDEGGYRHPRPKKG